MMVVKALVESALLEEVWGNRVPRSDVGRNETASVELGFGMGTQKFRLLALREREAVWSWTRCQPCHS